MTTHSLSFEESGMTRKDIILWWEKRRHEYNAYIGVVGIVSVLLALTAGGAAVQPGEDFVEPMSLVTGPALWVALANAFYTLGWLIDVAAYRNGPRVWLYKAGLAFSLAVTALPGIWAVAALVITKITGKLL